MPISGPARRSAPPTASEAVPSAPDEPRMPLDIAANLPSILRIGAAISWRIVAIALGLYVLWQIVETLIEIVVPVGIALLLAALLAPLVRRLRGWGVPRALATAIVIIGGLGVVGGLLTFAVTQFADGLPALRDQLSVAVDRLNHWLVTGPLHLQDNRVQEWLKSVQDRIQGNQGAVASQVVDTAVTVTRVAAGAVLTIFTLIFFLYDGDRIWSFLTRAVPGQHRDRVDTAGRVGFAALESYVRATVVVATIDAASIGLGLWIIGVPLAVPLATLIFLGAFVPILGAFVTGTVAVAVALVANGVVSAFVVLGLLIAVMQVEGHILQPLFLGRAVQLHPLAVVLTIGVGLTVAAIPGALLAVPLLAVLNASIRSLVAPSAEADDLEALGVVAES